MSSYDEEDVVAAWEAVLLPDWRWEALEVKADGLYYGRVRSPYTYGKWEYGHFTEDQLREAKAYRVDKELDENEPVFPDYLEELEEGIDEELEPGGGDGSKM